MDMERRLVFYRWRSVDGAPPFDRLAAAEAIEHLADTPARKLRHGDFSIDVEINAVGDDTAPTKIIIEKLRSYEERPWARAPGEVATPTNIRPDQDMLDFSHAVIWPDGYAAFTVGGLGPAPSALVAFLEFRVDQALALIPLYEQDLVERLRNWRGLRMVSLSIRNSSAVQTELNATQGAFRGILRQITQEQDIAVLRTELAVPRRGKGARQRLLSIPVEDVVELAEHSEAFDSLRVVGLTRAGRIERFDLITQRLQVIRRLPRAAQGGHRTDDEATFHALLNARATVESDGQLQRAAEASLA